MLEDHVLDCPRDLFSDDETLSKYCICLYLGFYFLMMKYLVNMHQTILGLYLLIMRPVVNMYLTPWMVVLLMNSSHVTASGLSPNTEHCVIS